MQSQGIDVINSFSRVGISKEEQLFSEVYRYFDSNKYQSCVILILKKGLCDQAKYSRLSYKNFQNGLPDCGFVVIKVDPYLFVSKTVICVEFVGNCLFWVCSQSKIDKVLKSFKEDGPIYNWKQSKGESLS